MHELSISLKTIELAVEQAKKYQAHRITKITLSIGVLFCIELDTLRFTLEYASRETLAEGAIINIESVPATANCLNCGKIVTIEKHQDACPICFKYQLAIETGEELKIKHIEVV